MTTARSFQRILLVLAAICGLWTHAFAARYVPFRVQLDTKDVLEAGTGDNGSPNEDAVWRYLNRLEFEPVKDFRVEPDPDDVLRATLKGKIRITANYGGTVEVEELHLVRKSKDSTKWKMVSEDVELTFDLRKGIKRPKTKTTAGGGGAATTARGEKYALVIGVRNYDKNELRSLSYTEPDADSIAKVLEDQDYARVVLMTQTKGATEQRFLPTAENIRKSLTGILENIQEGDTILIALAGHGVQFAGDDEQYFCPMDAKLKNRQSLIGLREVYRQLEKCPARFKLLLVDACRNDPQSDNSRALAEVKLESVTRPRKQLPPGGVAALFSCSEGEKAYECKELGHGIFFHFVLQGLAGKADTDKDNQVDFDELVSFTKRRVWDKVKDEFGDDYRQMPEAIGKVQGVVPLVRLTKANSGSIPQRSANRRKSEELLELAKTTALLIPNDQSIRVGRTDPEKAKRRREEADYVLADIGREFARRGDLLQAMEIAQPIMDRWGDIHVSPRDKSPIERSSLQRDLAISLAEGSRFREALDVAKSVSSESLRNMALYGIGNEQAKQGRVNEISATLDAIQGNGDMPPYLRAALLANVAKHLAEQGQIDSAKQFCEQCKKQFRSLGPSLNQDSNPVEIWQGLLAAYAWLGDDRGLQEAADLIRSHFGARWPLDSDVLEYRAMAQWIQKSPRWRETLRDAYAANNESNYSKSAMLDTIRDFKNMEALSQVANEWMDELRVVLDKQPTRQTFAFMVNCSLKQTVSGDVEGARRTLELLNLDRHLIHTRPYGIEEADVIGLLARVQAASGGLTTARETVRRLESEEFDLPGDWIKYRKVSQVIQCQIAIAAAEHRAKNGGVVHNALVMLKPMIKSFSELHSWPESWESSSSENILYLTANGYGDEILSLADAEPCLPIKAKFYLLLSKASYDLDKSPAN